MDDDGRAFLALSHLDARNREVLDFVEWLRELQSRHCRPGTARGIDWSDLYSMFTSIRAVLEYLDRVDPQAAQTARLRYGSLSPWEGDPPPVRSPGCQRAVSPLRDEVVATLTDLLKQRLQYLAHDGYGFFDAIQNARLVADAERYYRAMYYSGNESWNSRDQHMFETLELVLGFMGPTAKAVVWEHNSHLGDAASTDMGAGGQTNVGHLCREAYGRRAYLIGQATDHGTVAAASNWDQPVAIMQVRPAHPRSYEHLCHESRVEAFFLPLRKPRQTGCREELAASRLERAIGVVYPPDTELASHYFHACLPQQFDELIWFHRSEAVQVLAELDDCIDARIDRRAQPLDHRFDLMFHVVRILAGQQADVERDRAAIGDLVVLGSTADRADVEDGSTWQQRMRLVRQSRFELAQAGQDRFHRLDGVDAKMLVGGVSLAASGGDLQIRGAAVGDADRVARRLAIDRRVADEAGGAQRARADSPLEVARHPWKMTSPPER